MGTVHKARGVGAAGLRPHTSEQSKPSKERKNCSKSRDQPFPTRARCFHGWTFACYLRIGGFEQQVPHTDGDMVFALRGGWMA